MGLVLCRARLGENNRVPQRGEHQCRDKKTHGRKLRLTQANARKETPARAKRLHYDGPLSGPKQNGQQHRAYRRGPWGVIPFSSGRAEPALAQDWRALASMQACLLVRASP